MVHQTLPDRVVPPGGKSEFELRPDPVRARDEHGMVDVVWYLVQASELAEFGEGETIACRSDQLLESFLGAFRRIEVDAGVRVAETVRHVLPPIRGIRTL